MHVLLFVLAALVILFLLSLTPAGVDFRRRLMARFYTSVQERYERHMASRKESLFAELSGTVLEIGPGNGCNFSYLPDRVTRWIGIEPNRFMHDELRAAAAKRGIPTEFRTVTAEAMEVADASVDCVLGTLVLCSVPDPRAVLRDVHRILAPGGRFVFVEHVGAPRGSWLRRFQRFIRPLWSYLADGCHPDRDMADAIRAAGFREVRLEEFRLPRKATAAVVSPHIAGVAVK